MSAVDVQGLSKSFGAVKALHEVTFQVSRGELFAIIGPDGAGKTSLLRILVTLLLPDQGSAKIMGYDVVNNHKEIRKICGYMPGRFSLYPDLSVEENLLFYAKVFGTNVKDNYHLIEDIYHQIEPFRKRPAGKLSGGMKQKLALSCALIHKPEILILDEPTTGVDAVSRAEFWEILARLKQEEITILVSTPYMDEAMRCEKVALMQSGTILDLDKPQHIVDSYPLQLFAVKGENMYGILHALRSISGVQAAYRYGQEIHISLEEGALGTGDLLRHLIQKGFPDALVGQVSPTIEDCFMAFMQEDKGPKVDR